MFSYVGIQSFLQQVLVVVLFFWDMGPCSARGVGVREFLILDVLSWQLYRAISLI